MIACPFNLFLLTIACMVCLPRFTLLITTLISSSFSFNVKIIGLRDVKDIMTLPIKIITLFVEAWTYSSSCLIRCSTSDNVCLNLFNCCYLIWTGVLLTSLILIRLFPHSDSMTSWKNITCNVVPFCCNLHLVIQHLLSNIKYVFDRNIWL
jgi:hypothetical protein